MVDEILENPNKSKTNHYGSEQNLAELYTSPEYLQMLSSQLSEQEQLDPQKISKIKELLNNNQLSLDPLALANKIVEFETNFFKAKN